MMDKNAMHLHLVQCGQSRAENGIQINPIYKQALKCRLLTPETERLIWKQTLLPWLTMVIGKYKNEKRGTKVQNTIGSPKLDPAANYEAIQVKKASLYTGRKNPFILKTLCTLPLESCRRIVWHYSTHSMPSLLFKPSPISPMPLATLLVPLPILAVYIPPQFEALLCSDN